MTVSRRQFSVAMCVYKNDNPHHFRTALDSILNQTVPPSEIVLVVDGPVPDGMSNIITEYRSRHEILKPIFLERNVGHGNARRIAVKASSNELIAIMDSDDISVPDRFERQITCFEEDDRLSLLGGNISEFVGDESNVVGKRVVPTDDMQIKEYIKQRCPFNHVTVMFKKSEVLKVGNYKDWFWNEDYYLWIRMYEANCRFGNLSDILVMARVGPDMYKRRGGIEYFRSEARLQKYMLERGIITRGRYLMNVAIRLILQVLMPSSVRGFVFRRFARESS